MGLILQDEALQADFVDEIMGNIPLSEDEGRNDVTEALSEVARDQSGAVGAVGLIGLAWSGTAMFGVLRSSLNMVFQVEQPRPLLIQKLVDIGIVLSFMPFFILSIAATSVQRAARVAAEDIPVLGDAADPMGIGWDIASLVLPILISFIAFFLVYWLVPAQRSHARYIMPGAILAAVLFEVVKVGFNLYLENFSQYDIVFGSLGAVVAFMFWVYLSANITLLGAEIASEGPGVWSGEYDDQGTQQGPKRSFDEKALRLARSLVLQPKEESAPLSGATEEEKKLEHER